MGFPWGFKSLARHQKFDRACGLGPIKFLVYGELNPHGRGSARGAPAYLTWQSLLVQAFPQCCTEAEM